MVANGIRQTGRIPFATIYSIRPVWRIPSVPPSTAYALSGVSHLPPSTAYALSGVSHLPPSTAYALSGVSHLPTSTWRRITTPASSRGGRRHAPAHGAGVPPHHQTLPAWRGSPHQNTAAPAAVLSCLSPSPSPVGRNTHRLVA